MGDTESERRVTEQREGDRQRQADRRGKGTVHTQSFSRSAIQTDIINMRK